MGLNSTSATVDHAAAIEACNRARWMIEQAYVLLVKPCHASLLLDGAEPEVVMEAISSTIREINVLGERFSAAQGAHP